LTPQQMEAVIRRASELQAGASERADEGMSASEVVRIAREIGLAPEHVQRALAEVAGKEAPPEGLPGTLFGIAHAAASRTIRGNADEVSSHLEQYLTEREWLMPVRRFPDHTRYERSRGVDLARALSRAREAFGGERQPLVGAGFQLRDARSLDVAVQQLEPGFSHVSLAVDLSNYRAGLVAGGAAVGGGGGAVVAAMLGIAIAPPAAILGLPVLAAAWWGMRAIQNHMIGRAQLHLEALLDAMERGEPLVRRRRLNP
jgi:hypothetical protein